MTKEEMLAYNDFLKDLAEEMYSDYNSRKEKITKCPDYAYDDIVSFMHNGEKKTGRVYIVDALGTFEQDEEPSYDVMVEEENCLYKHIRESLIIDETN